MRILIFMTLFSVLGSAKLLDKIKAVVDDHIITQSDLLRVKQNLKARRGISRTIYNKETYSTQDLLDEEINIKVIRSHLNSIGYIINDDQVETMINTIERQNNLRREDLINYLKSENISYEEYFELLRATKERNLLINVIIEPLVSITDQQIKNEFFRRNLKNKTFSIDYFLVGYTIEMSKVSDTGELKSVINKYLSSGILPKKYSTLEEINIGRVKEDELEETVANILKGTDEGSLSTPIQQGNNYTTYLVRTKNLSESSLYTRAKPQLRAYLFAQESIKVLKVWIERQREKHFIKKF